MIRQPSLDIIKLMKQIDWKLPPLKVVLCKSFLLISHRIEWCVVFSLFTVPAELGVGMSLCLFHVLHYGFRKKMLLVNTPTGN
jgi:hypothetical protein